MSNVKVVSGGAGILGTAIGRGFAEAGSSVFVLDKKTDTPHLRSLQEDFPNLVTSIRVDVTRTESLASAFHGINGNISSLVLLVGGLHEGPFLQMSEAASLQSVKLNLLQAAWQIQHVLPGMIESRHGDIVMVSSISALKGSRQDPLYAAAKAGLIALATSLNSIYAPSGIRVNCIAPGSISNSGFADRMKERYGELEYLKAITILKSKVPARTLVDAHRLAEWVRFLCSPAGRIAGGANFIVDGGEISA